MIRYARTHLRAWFHYLPQRPGYNKRLRAALPLIKKAIRDLARDSDFWFDNHWIVDSIPTPCGMSRPTVQRSDLAGWAGYGYYSLPLTVLLGPASVSGVHPPTGMPIMPAPANPKIGEREVLAAMLDVDAGVVAEHAGILLISDKGFASRTLERDLAEQGIHLLRPSRKREKARHGGALLTKVRQLMGSVNDTLKGQLGLEQHGGRTFAGVAVRIAQRLLAVAAAIWHNNKTAAPITRSLIAYDH